jgi:hypothetical protein
MSDTGNETYHGGTANGNSCIGVLFKNFYFGLINCTLSWPILTHWSEGAARQSDDPEAAARLANCSGGSRASVML